MSVAPRMRIVIASSMYLSRFAKTSQLLVFGCSSSSFMPSSRWMVLPVVSFWQASSVFCTSSISETIASMVSTREPVNCLAYLSQSGRQTWRIKAEDRSP